MTFSQFMREGGFGMIPLMLFGLITLGAGIWFAVRPAVRALAFTGAMWLLVFTSMMHTMLINVSSVLRSMQDSFGQHGPIELGQILTVGLKESGRPGALGGIFLSLTTLAVAVGLFRKRLWQPAVAAAQPSAPAPSTAAPAAPRA